MIQTTGTDATGVVSSVKGRWSKLDAKRSPILTRARDCAKVTVPSLFTPDGFNETTKLYTPYQGLGARGVNNLASKLILTLLPPQSPFFKMKIDENVIQELEKAGVTRPVVEEALGKLERGTMDWIETNGCRVPLFQALKQLIVTGNALLYIPDTKGMKVFKLNQYVTKRDPMGNVLEIILKENVHPIVLPDSVRNMVQAKYNDPDATTEVYTRVYRQSDNKKWVVEQEVEGIDIPESSGTYPLDDCPWIPLRWNTIEGEDYGRGHVEDYLGDVLSLESLTKSIVTGSAAAAKVLFLNKPNGTTSTQRLAKAESGDIIAGNADDVSTLQVNKHADFKIAFETIGQITKRLEHAFLLNSSIQRNGERVTAEEIRFMAGELEDALGGVYSVLSQEMPKLVKRFMVQMSKAHKLPPLPQDKIKPMITTGLEALGRGHDLNKLDAFAQRLQPFGDRALEYIDMSDFIRSAATGLGLDVKVKSEKEVADAQQRQQQVTMMSEMASKATPNIVKGAIENGKGQGQGTGE